MEGSEIFELALSLLLTLVVVFSANPLLNWLFKRRIKIEVVKTEYDH